MTSYSLFVFTVRGIVLFIVWVLRQLPSSWDVQVDRDAIIRAITIAGPEAGSRRDAGHWHESPSTQDPNNDIDPSTNEPRPFFDRDAAFSDMAALKDHMERFVPDKINPSREHSILQSLPLAC